MFIFIYFFFLNQQLVRRMSSAGRQGPCPNHWTRSKGSKWTSPHRASHRGRSPRQILGFYQKSNQNSSLLFKLVWRERCHSAFCADTGRHRQDCNSQTESQCVLDPPSVNLIYESWGYLVVRGSISLFIILPFWSFQLFLSLQLYWLFAIHVIQFQSIY